MKKVLLSLQNWKYTFINQGICRSGSGFSATVERITEEWLLAYPFGKAQHWTERRYDVEGQRTDRGGMGNLWEERNLERSHTSQCLVSSTAIQLNNQQLIPVFSWFSDVLRVSRFGQWSSEFSIEACRKLIQKRKLFHYSEQPMSILMISSWKKKNLICEVYQVTYQKNSKHI